MGRKFAFRSVRQPRQARVQPHRRQREVRGLQFQRAHPQRHCREQLGRLRPLQRSQERRGCQQRRLAPEQLQLGHPLRVRAESRTTKISVPSWRTTARWRAMDRIR
jgi:hypothetical protein